MIHLDKEEKIEIIIRKHWFVFFSESIVFVIMAAAPLMLSLDFNFNFFPFIYLTWLLILWIILAREWTDYYLDALIITNKRIIDVEQKGLFRREIASCFLENIQDVTTNISGVIATFLDFGDLSIQTAGERREFTVHWAKSPDKAKQIILGNMQKRKGPS